MRFIKPGSDAKSKTRMPLEPLEPFHMVALGTAVTKNCLLLPYFNQPYSELFSDIHRTYLVTIFCGYHDNNAMIPVKILTHL